MGYLSLNLLVKLPRFLSADSKSRARSPSDKAVKSKGFLFNIFWHISELWYASKSILFSVWFIISESLWFFLWSLSSKSDMIFSLESKVSTSSLWVRLYLYCINIMMVKASSKIELMMKYTFLLFLVDFISFLRSLYSS